VCQKARIKGWYCLSKKTEGGQSRIVTRQKVPRHFVSPAACANRSHLFEAKERRESLAFCFLLERCFSGLKRSIRRLGVRKSYNIDSQCAEKMTGPSLSARRKRETASDRLVQHFASRIKRSAALLVGPGEVPISRGRRRRGWPSPQLIKNATASLSVCARACVSCRRAL